jgi:alpha/beta superfamily hydrolase
MEDTVTVEAAPGVSLQGRLASVPGARGGLVLCHPHPLYGGDMDNPVVVRAAEVAREIGVSTLRISFRGVGGSSGTHDRGEGEQEDVLAALAFLGQRLGPGQPLGLAGYSFGAWVSARAAERDPHLTGLCLIAPPLAMVAVEPPDPRRLRLLVVAGTGDEYCPAAQLDAFAARLPPGTVARIDGANHFFFGKLYPMGEAVRDWVRAWARA